jgi:hypothetical protein
VALAKNLALNGIADVAVHRVAIGHKAATVAMTTHLRSSNHLVLQGISFGPAPFNVSPVTIQKTSAEAFPHIAGGGRMDF